eukprot:SAG31_NODE_2064_length_6532_cov_3.118918_4_plen_116_part_00
MRILDINQRCLLVHSHLVAQKQQAQEEAKAPEREARLAAAKQWDEEQVIGIKILNLISSCGVRNAGDENYVPELKDMTDKIGGTLAMMKAGVRQCNPSLSVDHSVNHVLIACSSG